MCPCQASQACACGGGRVGLSVRPSLSNNATTTSRQAVRVLTEGEEGIAAQDEGAGIEEGACLGEGGLWVGVSQGVGASRDWGVGNRSL